MKTAVYIEDGTLQLVITPENEFEKNAIKAFEGEGIETRVFRGSFYDCRGGWVRQKYHTPEDNLMTPAHDHEDRSLILRLANGAGTERSGGESKP